MNIHEYQAKKLLSRFGVPVLRGQVAYTPQEAQNIAKEMGGNLWVVKAQIHAGGRGKGGGIKLAKNLEDVQGFTKQMIGMKLVTPQTGPKGKRVGRVYIEEGAPYQKQFYVSMLVDRNTSRITLIASAEGGVEIEEVAATHPEKIIRQSFDPIQGFQPYYARKVGFKLGLSAIHVNQFVKFVQGLYNAFQELDASLIEINPLVITDQGLLVALDAKMNFDENALYRQKEVLEMRDLDEEDAAEVEASNSNLNYIKLDGNIGCMVNGAGLAMATMDMIKLYGGSPANFLDVGGSATKERVTAAFKLILSDPNVEAILVNIFGGIMRCDVIAEGIVSAAREISLHVPLVVRLQGTNVDMGRKILQQSGLPILSAETLADAAQRIVTAVKEAA
jgi:succinyl-CoA synthetase beta subunit